MTNATIKRVVIFGALAITGVLVIQLYTLRQIWNFEQRDFRERARIALINAANDLAELNDYPLPSKDLIAETEPGYFVVNINNVINANNLEYFLQRELERVGFNEDFEYGIYDCANQEMVYGNYIQYSGQGEQKEARRNDLPTYDEFLYYFGVRFPDRTEYLFSKMRLPLLFSVILVITILFFLYSIFIILRQKMLSEMQKEFINNMTHEFKTPISTIKISTDVFQNHDLVKSDERLSRYADIIKDQNQRLNNQVEKVLQIARIERKTFQLNLTEVDLHRLLIDVAEGVDLRIKKLGGTISLDLAAKSGKVNADELHLTNILYSLLDNAIKYRKGPPEIRITTRDPGGKLLVAIADKGIGIGRENQKKVFKKFYRVPTGNVHNVKGFGLGLFYVKHICHAHSWKIDLESTLGEGTTISILL